MITTESILLIEAINHTEKITPGTLVRERGHIDTMGVVLSVEDHEYAVCAQVLWSYRPSIIERSIQSMSQQIAQEEDAEIFRVLTRVR